jgi:hypothetical protein
MIPPALGSVYFLKKYCPNATIAAMAIAIFKKNLLVTFAIETTSFD